MKIGPQPIFKKNFKEESESLSIIFGNYVKFHHLCFL